jgi:hypothetical protein
MIFKSTRKLLGRIALSFAVAGFWAISLSSEGYSQNDDQKLRIAFIGDLGSDRGKAAAEVYRKYVDETNRDGISIGGAKRRIAAIFLDSGSNPAKATQLAREAIEKEKVVLIVCSSMACRVPGEELSTPTILTASGSMLSGANPMTFLINAPGPDDLTKQAILARSALNDALSRAREATAGSIAVALRGVNIKTSEGSVSFDKSGNNFGPVAFRRTPLSRPDGAGCADKCEKSCPAECSGACNKTGENECCSICSKPRP